MEDPGVSLQQIRETYRHVRAFNLLNDVTLSVEALLKRPGRRLLVPPDIRFLMTLWELPTWYEKKSEHHYSILARFLGTTSGLSNELHRYLVSWLTHQPEQIFKRKVDLVLQFITHKLSRQAGMLEKYPTDWSIKAAARVAALLFAANNLRNDALPLSHFYVTMVDYVDVAKDYARWQEDRGAFVFCQYPFLMSLGTKMHVLELDAKRTMAEMFRESFYISAFHAVATDPFFTIRVRRAFLIQDSLNQISAVRPLDLKKRLKIEFVGEEGVDAGGLTKEWMMLLVKDLFDPQYGMFVFDEESNLCWFNRWNVDTDGEYRLVGMVLGLAIYNSTILEVNLASAVYKMLLGYPVTLADVKQLHPSLARGLQQLLEYPGDDVQDVFMRDFVVEEEVFGHVERMELKPGGVSIPVTKANREEYVQLYTQWLFEGRQFQAFKQGFDSVCKGPLSLFKPPELELVLRGDEVIDMRALEGVTEYENCGRYDNVIKWFWETVHLYPLELKKKLLIFSTGTDRICPTGIQNMAYKISVVQGDVERLPQAHTCFNQLVLPRYTSHSKLEQKLTKAITDCSMSFGLK
jgi:E3 ubiquitin-protein ligase HECTD2